MGVVMATNVYCTSCLGRGCATCQPHNFSNGVQVAATAAAHPCKCGCAKWFYDNPPVIPPVTPKPSLGPLPPVQFNGHDFCLWREENPDHLYCKACGWDYRTTYAEEPCVGHPPNRLGPVSLDPDAYKASVREEKRRANERYPGWPGAPITVTKPFAEFMQEHNLARAMSIPAYAERSIGAMLTPARRHGQC